MLLLPYICLCAEDKKDDESFVKQRLNEQFIKAMDILNTRRRREVLEQQRIEKKDRLRRQLGHEETKSNLDVQNPEVQKPKTRGKDKKSLMEQEREIHEAYQTLSRELEKRKIQREKHHRIKVIRQKEHAEAMAKKHDLWRRIAIGKDQLTRVSSKQYTILISLVCLCLVYLHIKNTLV